MKPPVQNQQLVLVGDDYEAYDLVSAYFRPKGYSVKYFSTPQKALLAAETEGSFWNVLITDFNKLCKNYIENSNSNANKQNLEKYYKVIKTMFQCGLHSDNKKAFNILENQLLKYTNITDTFKDLIPTLRAEKLAKKLEIKGIKAKKFKI